MKTRIKKKIPTFFYDTFCIYSSQTDITFHSKQYPRLKIQLRLFCVNSIWYADGDCFEYVLKSSFDTIEDIIPIDWVGKMLSYCMTIADVPQYFSNEDTYSVKLIEYCADNVPFRVSVKIGNSFYEMKTIKEAIEAMS